MVQSRRPTTRMPVRSEKENGYHRKPTGAGMLIGNASGKLTGSGFAHDKTLGRAANRLARGTLASDAITPEERWNMIAVAAYYRAEERGFIGGSPADDWIAAEKEIDSLLDGEK